MGQGPTIQTLGNWAQVINIGKLFENNNLTLIPKPLLQSKSKAYVLYIKIFWKLDASGSLEEGPVHGF